MGGTADPTRVHGHPIRVHGLSRTSTGSLEPAKRRWGADFLNYCYKTNLDRQNVFQRIISAREPFVKMTKLCDPTSSSVSSAAVEATTLTLPFSSATFGPQIAARAVPTSFGSRKKLVPLVKKDKKSECRSCQHKLIAEASAEASVNYRLEDMGY